MILGIIFLESTPLTKTASLYIQLGQVACIPGARLAKRDDCDDKDTGDICEVLGDDLKLQRGSCVLVEESVSPTVCYKLGLRL